MKFFLILNLLFSVTVLAVKNESFTVSHYVKCYELFVRERPIHNDSNIKAISEKKITSLQACMNLLNSAKFRDKLKIIDPENNYLGQKVLRTFNQFHATWFPNHLTYMTTDGPETFDLVELEEPALFITQALFNPEWKYKDILKGNRSYEGIRIAKEKNQYLIGSLSRPKIKYENDYFLSGLKDYVRWSPRRLDRGILVGIKETTKSKDILPSSVDDLFYPKLSSDPIDIHDSAGGGFIGTNSYLLFNIGRSLGEKSNGANSMPRKLFQQMVKDILCRELPVLEPDDTIKYLVSGNSVPWGNNKNCMSCHVTMDNMAAVLRNAEIVLSRDDGKGSYHVKLHKTIKKAEVTPLYSKQDDYYQTEGSGRFVYRDINYRLIDKPIAKLDDIGQQIANLDDFYHCATTRYLHFLTGIKVDAGSTSPEKTNLKLKKDIMEWSKKLKDTQKLDVLIEDIIDSRYFREGNPTID